MFHLLVIRYYWYVRSEESYERVNKEIKNVHNLQCTFSKLSKNFLSLLQQVISSSSACFNVSGVVSAPESIRDNSFVRSLL